MRTIGIKILRADGRSLNGRVEHPVGEWVDVPGHGAYVAVSGGLWSAGEPPQGAIYCTVECREPTGASAPDGVVCFRRVHRLPGPPDPEILERCALAEPAAALRYASDRLTQSVLEECARRAPAAALQYAAGRLSQPVLESCARAEPAAALRLVADRLPHEVLEECDRMFLF